MLLLMYLFSASGAPNWAADVVRLSCSYSNISFACMSFKGMMESAVDRMLISLSMRSIVLRERTVSKKGNSCGRKFCLSPKM